MDPKYLTKMTGKREGLNYTGLFRRKSMESLQNGVEK
jgi:hypothetical protein